MTPPFPTGRYQLLYVDPPWHFATYSDKGQGKSPSRHYATMSTADICTLPIGDLAAPDAGLALWCYGPRLPDAFKVAAAWGFTFNSDLFHWMKRTVNGLPTFGGGYTTRKSVEQCLYFVRGKGLKVVDRSVRQEIVSVRREHSRKPDEVYDALERLFGADVSRIELFARNRRAGWTSWGNEVSAEIDWLEFTA